MELFLRYDLNGKKVLITGASSGIGLETALAFAENGAHVILVARNWEKLEELAAQIRGKGGQASCHRCDLGSEEEIKKMLLAVDQEFLDGIDVLVNSAGNAHLGSVDATPASAFEDTLMLNFFAPLLLIQGVIPKMKKRRSGQVINISSGAGKRGLPNASPYCVSKFALNALTESLRVELAPFHIDVISVSPGLVKTPFHDRMITHGIVKERFVSGKMTAVGKVARKIVVASQKRQREVTLSLRTQVGTILNFLSPRIVDSMLIRKLRR